MSLLLQVKLGMYNVFLSFFLKGTRVWLEVSHLQAFFLFILTRITCIYAFFIYIYTSVLSQPLLETLHKVPRATETGKIVR